MAKKGILGALGLKKGFLGTALKNTPGLGKALKLMSGGSKTKGLLPSIFESMSKKQDKGFYGHMGAPNLKSAKKKTKIIGG